MSRVPGWGSASSVRKQWAAEGAISLYEEACEGSPDRDQDPARERETGKETEAGLLRTRRPTSVASLMPDDALAGGSFNANFAS